MDKLTRIILLVWILIAIAFLSFAQPNQSEIDRGMKLAQEQLTCNDELIMAQQGKWAKRPDANMKAANLAQITARIDKMQQLVQAAYAAPKGGDAGWYRSMGGYYSPAAKGMDAYELNVLFKAYYCNTSLKKLMLGIEAGTTFDIWTNKFKWFAEADKSFTIENKPVYMLSKRSGELNGFLLFSGNDNGHPNTGATFSRTMLISRSGALPYTPVTRRQYLVAFLKVKDSLANPSGNRDVYQRDIKAGQDYLQKSSSEELEKPAYVENTSYVGSFRKFATESEGRMLVTVNEKYFNPKLAAHIPQFIVVYWRWNTEKPCVEFAKQIQANFNFKALQDMLDK